MNRKYFSILIFSWTVSFCHAQNIGIGTTNPQAKLEISSTNSGLLIPRLTTTAKNAIANPPRGLLVYDSTIKQFYFHNGTDWESMASATSLWQQSGVAGNEIKNTNAGGFWSVATTGLDGNSTNVTNPVTAPVSGAGTRLMWIPSRSAFRAGTVFDVDGNTASKSWNKDSIGLFSFASGVNTVASGNTSTAMGDNTTASDAGSTAMGYHTLASGVYSTALGSFTQAKNYSTAIGTQTQAVGSSSTAMGAYTKASGDGSTAMGAFTIASGDYSTALGNGTQASANNATAIGYSTKASGIGSTAMGSSTIASGIGSTAMGFSTTASGSYSTAMGSDTRALGVYSTTMGNYVTASGGASIAMGFSTTASGNYSTAMGSYGNTNDHTGSFIIHDNINENVDGITRNSLDNQMIMKFDGGFGFYVGDASAPSMGFEKTQGLSVYGGGNIRAVSGIVSANGVTLTSDKRFKNTIANIQYGLNAILQFRPVSYLWNAERVHNNAALKGTQLGFIAQEVEQIIPSAVLTDTDSLQSKSIKYIELIPVLTRAIQEQQAQIEMLQKENGALSKRVEKLEK